MPAAPSIGQMPRVMVLGAVAGAACRTVAGEEEAKVEPVKRSLQGTKRHRRASPLGQRDAPCQARRPLDPKVARRPETQSSRPRIPRQDRTRQSVAKGGPTSVLRYVAEHVLVRDGERARTSCDRAVEPAAKASQADPRSRRPLARHPPSVRRIWSRIAWVGNRSAPCVHRNDEMGRWAGRSRGVGDTSAQHPHLVPHGLQSPHNRVGVHAVAAESVDVLEADEEDFHRAECGARRC